MNSKILSNYMLILTIVTATQSVMADEILNIRTLPQAYPVIYKETAGVSREIRLDAVRIRQVEDVKIVDAFYAELRNQYGNVVGEDKEFKSKDEALKFINNQNIILAKKVHFFRFYKKQQSNKWHYKPGSKKIIELVNIKEKIDLKELLGMLEDIKHNFYRDLKEATYSACIGIQTAPGANESRCIVKEDQKNMSCAAPMPVSLELEPKVVKLRALDEEIQKAANIRVGDGVVAAYIVCGRPNKVETIMMKK